jgi:hypothetical protein
MSRQEPAVNPAAGAPGLLKYKKKKKIDRICHKNGKRPHVLNTVL